MCISYILDNRRICLSINWILSFNSDIFSSKMKKISKKLLFLSILKKKRLIIWLKKAAIGAKLLIWISLLWAKKDLLIRKWRIALVIVVSCGIRTYRRSIYLPWNLLLLLRIVCLFRFIIRFLKDLIRRIWRELWKEKLINSNLFIVLMWVLRK